MKIIRNIYNYIDRDFAKPNIVILIGARQVGKSFLLKEIESEALAKGYKTAYFNLEIPEDLRIFSLSDSDIYDLLINAGDVIFVDEFHYAKNISHIFKAIYDKSVHSGKTVKIYASGSSSIEIHKHIKESMAGRRQIYKISPLNFTEILSWREDALEYLLNYGGMPALTHFSENEQRQMHLASLVEAYLFKDIKSLIKEENIRAFNNLLFHIAETQGSIVNVNNLAREIGLSAPSIQKYLDIMDATYVTHSLHSYSTNFANELKKSKKYYLYDIGIRNFLTRNFAKISKREDKGVLYESLVFLELHKLIKPNVELRFWRTKSGDEVDFIWVEDRLPIAIEVKSHLKNSNEIPKGIKTFLEKYPKTKCAIIFNENINEISEYKNIKIHFVTFNKIEGLRDLLNSYM